MTVNLARTSDSARTETFEGHVRKTGVFVGFVKDNRDAQRMGRLMVYIPEFGGDPKDEANWVTCSYASPFAGATSVDETKKGDKTMKGSQQSYGFWMVPPDLENEVLCCFVNGDMARGYWFACLYQQFMNHMVPGIPVNKSTRDDINKLNTPPVVEYNKQAEENVWDPKRPVFEPLHNGLVAQGLYADAERGPQTSGARREAPSKVFGFSTPRGNNIHIDDDPSNEFIRLRTRSGVQIVIHETTGYIYMISKQGNSWMEISDVGIDMYSKRSISLRAEENINLHADKNIVMHGAGAIHHTSANITFCSSGRITTHAGGEHRRTSPRLKDNSKNNATKKKAAAKKEGEKPEDNKKPGAPGTGDEAAKTPDGKVDNTGESINNPDGTVNTGSEAPAGNSGTDAGGGTDAMGNYTGGAEAESSPSESSGGGDIPAYEGTVDDGSGSEPYTDGNNSGSDSGGEYDAMGNYTGGSSAPQENGWESSVDDGSGSEPYTDPYGSVSTNPDQFNSSGPALDPVPTNNQSFDSIGGIGNQGTSVTGGFDVNGPTMQGTPVGSTSPYGDLNTATVQNTAYGSLNTDSGQLAQGGATNNFAPYGPVGTATLNGTEAVAPTSAPAPESSFAPATTAPISPSTPMSQARFDGFALAAGAKPGQTVTVGGVTGVVSKK